MKKIDLEDMEEPEKPKIPANPIEAAQKRKLAKLIPKAISEVGKFYGGGSFVTNVSPVLSSRLIRNISNTNRNFWIDQYKNQLTIKLTKLSHTRTTVIDDDILIAPLSKGNFSITMNVICDEFSESKKFTIPIEIK